MNLASAVSAVVVLATLAACTRTEGPAMTRDGAAAAKTVTPTSTATPPLLPPLAGERTQKIELSQGRAAYLTIPIGAQEKRAIVVGVHGAGDRADWSCSEWQAVTAGWAFVVCPQGVTHRVDHSAFVWGSAESIAAEADEAVAALRSRYGDYIEDGPLIYGGWSQGGTLASQVIASRPGVYDRAVLVEVGHTPLDASTVVSNLEKGGIRRAVVSCSSANCRAWAKDFGRAARVVNRACHRFGFLPAGPVMHKDACAIASKAFGDGGADATGGAGDQGKFVFEWERHDFRILKG